MVSVFEGLRSFGNNGMRSRKRSMQSLITWTRFRSRVFAILRCLLRPVNRLPLLLVFFFICRCVKASSAASFSMPIPLSAWGLLQNCFVLYEGSLLEWCWRSWSLSQRTQPINGHVTYVSNGAGLTVPSAENINQSPKLWIWTSGPQFGCKRVIFVVFLVMIKSTRILQNVRKHPSEGCRNMGSIWRLLAYCHGSNTLKISFNGLMGIKGCFFYNSLSCLYGTLYGIRSSHSLSIYRNYKLEKPAMYNPSGQHLCFHWHQFGLWPHHVFVLKESINIVAIITNLYFEIH